MNYTNEEKQLIIENLEPIPEHELESMFDEYIDDTNDKIMVLGLEYYPSRVLKMVDSIAYRCGFGDWLDSMIGEGLLTDEIEGQHFRQAEVDELLESIEED
jgi:predicted TPR repeat methyltransferase